jgi:hypothetical protein
MGPALQLGTAGLLGGREEVDDDPGRWRGGAHRQADGTDYRVAVTTVTGTVTAPLSRDGTS